LKVKNISSKEGQILCQKAFFFIFYACALAYINFFLYLCGRKREDADLSKMTDTTGAISSAVLAVALAEYPANLPRITRESPANHPRLDAKKMRITCRKHADYMRIIYGPLRYSGNSGYSGETGNSGAPGWLDVQERQGIAGRQEIPGCTGQENLLFRKNIESRKFPWGIPIKK